MGTPQPGQYHLPPIGGVVCRYRPLRVRLRNISVKATDKSVLSGMFPRAQVQTEFTRFISSPHLGQNIRLSATTGGYHGLTSLHLAR